MIPRASGSGGEYLPVSGSKPEATLVVVLSRTCMTISIR